MLLPEPLMLRPDNSMPDATIRRSNEKNDTLPFYPPPEQRRNPGAA